MNSQIKPYNWILVEWGYQTSGPSTGKTLVQILIGSQSEQINASSRKLPSEQQTSDDVSRWVSLSVCVLAAELSTINRWSSPMKKTISSNVNSVCKPLGDCVRIGCKKTAPFGECRSGVILRWRQKEFESTKERFPTELHHISYSKVFEIVHGKLGGFSFDCEAHIITKFPLRGVRPVKYCTECTASVRNNSDHWTIGIGLDGFMSKSAIISWYPRAKLRQWLTCARKFIIKLKCGWMLFALWQGWKPFWHVSKDANLKQNKLSWTYLSIWTAKSPGTGIVSYAFSYWCSVTEKVWRKLFILFIW